MARVNRREVLSEGEVQVVHCVNRCVRRAFLCGTDPLTGNDYEHRRQWVRTRLEFLAGVFGIDVIGFSVMQNHLHVILRNRPDVVRDWSDEEVARRWWNLFPARREEDGSPAEPSNTDLNPLMSGAKLKELRARLSSISWLMRCTSEVLARMANAEENVTGRFWEGRFRATVLPDETAIASCMAYVDLNPIRARIAETPETSDYTSVQERIADLKSADDVDTADAKDGRMEHGERAGWLAPVSLTAPRKKVREKPTTRRASSKGCLPMSLVQYLELLDWTGRTIRRGKRGSIPPSVAGILDRLDLSEELWRHQLEQHAKRRSANSVTSAGRYQTATARPRAAVGSRRT